MDLRAPFMSVYRGNPIYPPPPQPSPALSGNHPLTDILSGLCANVFPRPPRRFDLTSLGCRVTATMLDREVAGSYSAGERLFGEREKWNEGKNERKGETEKEERNDTGQREKEGQRGEREKRSESERTRDREKEGRRREGKRETHLQKRLGQCSHER